MKAGWRNVVIWVDADAAPREVKEILFRASTRRELEMVLVANSPQPIPKAAAHARSVLVRQGADVADRYIVQHSQARDLAITADIPLAAALVEKEVVVIDPRGDEFSPANISARLSMRDFMDDLRGQGVMTSGAAPYSDRDKQAFASTFDRLLTRLLRQP